MIVTVTTAGNQQFEAPDHLSMPALKREVARRFGLQAPFVHHSFGARLDNQPLPVPAPTPSFSDPTVVLTAPLHHWPHKPVSAAR